MSLDVTKIVSHPFPASQYYAEDFAKKQVVLHHTVSGAGVEGDVKWWMSSPEKVATAFLIDRAGVVHKLFSSKQWAHHLGVKPEVFTRLGFKPAGDRNRLLNQQSVGIELDSWGGLVSSGGKWYLPNNNGTANLSAGAIPADRVQLYPQGFRGYKAFEKYTDAQIKSAVDLVEYLCDQYGINKVYQADMWDVSKRALGGEPGIWGHISYRHDKSDTHPQPSLIEGLKSLAL